MTYLPFGPLRCEHCDVVIVRLVYTQDCQACAGRMAAELFNCFDIRVEPQMRLSLPWEKALHDGLDAQGITASARVLMAVEGDVGMPVHVVYFAPWLFALLQATGAYAGGWERRRAFGQRHLYDILRYSRALARRPDVLAKVVHVAVLGGADAAFEAAGAELRM